MTKNKAYQLYNVDESITEEKLRKMFKKYSRKYHPDTTSDESKKKENEEIMKKYSEAYHIILKDIKSGFKKQTYNYSTNKNNDNYNSTNCEYDKCNSNSTNYEYESNTEENNYREDRYADYDFSRAYTAGSSPKDDHHKNNSGEDLKSILQDICFIENCENIFHIVRAFISLERKITKWKDTIYHDYYDYYLIYEYWKDILTKEFNLHGSILLPNNTDKVLSSLYSKIYEIANENDYEFLNTVYYNYLNLCNMVNDKKYFTKIKNNINTLRKQCRKNEEQFINKTKTERIFSEYCNSFEINTNDNTSNFYKYCYDCIDLYKYANENGININNSDSFKYMNFNFCKKLGIKGFDINCKSNCLEVLKIILKGYFSLCDKATTVREICEPYDNICLISDIFGDEYNEYIEDARIKRVDAIINLPLDNDSFTRH